MHADQRPVERARADGDLRLLRLRPRPQFFQLLDGRRKIGIGEQPPFASRFQHPVAHGIAFAAIAGVAQAPARTIRLVRRSRDSGGAVRRAVVHHQNFVKSQLALRQIVVTRSQSVG